MLKHALHNSERRCADYNIFLGIVCTQARPVGGPSKAKLANFVTDCNYVTLLAIFNTSCTVLPISKAILSHRPGVPPGNFAIAFERADKSSSVHSAFLIKNIKKTMYQKSTKQNEKESQVWLLYSLKLQNLKQIQTSAFTPLIFKRWIGY